jgi:hypothetical protein
LDLPFYSFPPSRSFLCRGFPLGVPHNWE